MKSLESLPENDYSCIDGREHTPVNNFMGGYEFFTGYHDIHRDAFSADANPIDDKYFRLQHGFIIKDLLDPEELRETLRRLTSRYPDAIDVASQETTVEPTAYNPNH